MSYTIACSYLQTTPPPGAISGRFRPRPRRIWLLCSPIASRMPSLRAVYFAYTRKLFPRRPHSDGVPKWVEPTCQVGAPVPTQRAGLPALRGPRPGYLRGATPSGSPGTASLLVCQTKRETYERPNSLPLSIYYYTILLYYIYY